MSNSKCPYRKRLSTMIVGVIATAAKYEAYLTLDSIDCPTIMPITCRFSCYYLWIFEGG